MGAITRASMGSPAPFIQSVASDTWTYSHTLGVNPIVDVRVNLNNVLQRIIPASIEYPDTNTVVVRFSEPRTGELSIV